MPLVSQAKEIVRALLGVSAYEKPANQYGGLLLEDATVEQLREALGGQIQNLPNTQLRWYLKDLETAQKEADSGNLMRAAQLYRATRRDGVIGGLLGTRCAGVTSLPKRFYGDPEIAGALAANNGSRSVFDEMFPPSEVSLLSADGVMLGVGVAELVPVQGRAYPILVRLDPENLQYRWNENRWYFRSTAGLLAITPGDGRWVLHLPGARMAPWNTGIWPAVGRSYINKEHAMSCRSNYSAKLANPARIAEAPLGASELERKGFLRKMLAWGMNQVFELPIGWKVTLLESNGIGIQVFQKEIDTSDHEAMVAICGEVVSVEGGSGFANSDLPKAIRRDLIKTDADGLAYTLNTQGLPLYLATTYGIEAITSRFTGIEWATDLPTDLKVTADTMSSLAGAIVEMTQALQAAGRELDIDALVTRFGIPVKAASPANDNRAKAKAAAAENRPALEARLREAA